MDSSISQPNPTTNNDDYHVGDPALANIIGRDLIYMKEVMVKVQKYVDRMNVQIIQASQKFEQLKTRGGEELSELKVAVKKLKSQIPSNLIMKTHYDDDSKPRRNPWFDGSINPSSNNYQVDVSKAGHSHSLYKEPKFHHIKVSFDALPYKLQNCLKCFLMLPEMVTIKKRFMIYWWIGEGHVSPTFSTSTDKEIALVKTAEEFSNEFLDEFTAKRFIEPIYKNCGLAVDSYRMHPSIHSALNQFCFKVVCTMVTKNRVYTPFALHECFLNVGEAIIDDRFEGFSKFVNFEIVYLGRWQNPATHHIEVPDTKILNVLKNMKQLRFLSLRGISLITELPQCISQLSNLKILDLNACHNLEVVPKWIGLLRSLTHLDISKCYFLDHMPKELGSLSELQVLKGFIIGDSKEKNSCTIDDLTKLRNLKKLSIYTRMKEFPTRMHLRHIQRLNALQKLKISWSECILRGETDDTSKQAQLHSKLTKALTRSLTEQHDSKLPSSLQKLELECFPKMVTPSWLWTGNLTNLEKLYIRGGLLCYLGPIATTTVKMLQLKYLSDLEMRWIDLKRLFPHLIYLEKVECPGLTCFPCDENGVWRGRGKI
ncbi:hypothetical protein CsSME_00044222 [Camellia sinensis var. sinensis]